MQQIILSGVGGQGVLFITKLLAEAALDMKRNVFISETHGMAQRGGNVISHLKVSQPAAAFDPKDAVKTPKRSPFVFTSPLVRPGRADILIALHFDSVQIHGFYLKKGGVLFCNCQEIKNRTDLDASRIAMQLGSPISANLVMLGFASGSGSLFCPPETIEQVLKGLGGKREKINLKAFRAGCEEARKRGGVSSP